MMGRGESRLTVRDPHVTGTREVGDEFERVVVLPKKRKENEENHGL